MITIFNRRELLITRSFRAYVSACDMLEMQRIEYKVMRGGYGNGSEYLNVHETEDTGMEYTLYVKNIDYKKAKQLLNKPRKTANIT